MVPTLAQTRTAWSTLAAIEIKSPDLAWLFIGLNAVDALTTVYLVTNGASEANPVMGALLSFGATTFVALKVSAAAALAFALARYMPRTLRAVCVVFAGVVGWQATLCVTL